MKLVAILLAAISIQDVVAKNNIRRLKMDSSGKDNADCGEANQETSGLDPTVCLDPFTTLAAVVKNHPLTVGTCQNNICSGGCCRFVADMFLVCDTNDDLAAMYPCMCANDGSPLPQPVQEAPSAGPTDTPTGTPTISPAPSNTPEPTGTPTAAPTDMPISIPGVSPAQQDASSKACLDGHATWGLSLPQAKCTAYDGCDNVPGTCCVKSFCRCSTYTDASYASVCVLPPI